MSWEARTPAPNPTFHREWKTWAQELITYLRRDPPSGAPGLVAWPVGSVMYTAANTNPAILLGGGTWVAVAAGPPVWSWQRTQ